MKENKNTITIRISKKSHDNGLKRAKETGLTRMFQGKLVPNLTKYIEAKLLE